MGFNSYESSFDLLLVWFILVPLYGTKMNQTKNLF